MSPRPIVCDDPIERIVMDGLRAAGIPFTHESQDNQATAGLDFRLGGEPPVYIECKAYATPRTAKQLEQAASVILIQGIDAAMAFRALLPRPHPQEDKP